MTRRIPAALGIVVVIAAVLSLHQLVPMVAMLARDSGAFDSVIWLLVGASVAQLAAGIAIAVGWVHARFALLAWTVVAVAVAVLARDMVATDTTTTGLVIMYVEALAGPAIAWLVPLFAGDLPPAPRIPRAHLVSSTPQLTAERDTAAIAARRFDVGVTLVGIGLLSIVGTVLARVSIVLMFVSAGSGGGSYITDLVFAGYEVLVGAYAIIAARRLLDPTVEGQHAHRALVTYVLLDIVGSVVRIGLMVGYQIIAGHLSNDMMTMVLVQWIASGVLGFVIPLLLWGYARPALAYRADGPPTPPPASRLAAVPAWAVLWFAPFLLARVFMSPLIDMSASEVSAGVFHWILIACGIQGAVHLVAAIATFVAHRVAAARTDDAPRDSGARRIARIAATIGVVNAAGLIACWVILIVGADRSILFRQQLPVGPLVQLVVCTATLAWILRARSR